MIANKRIIPALLAACLMTSSFTPALAATKKPTLSSTPKKSASSRTKKTNKTEAIFKLDAKQLAASKNKSGVAYWNVSPETFIEAFESVFNGNLKISDNKKANKNVFSYSSSSVTLSLYATSDSYSKSNLMKVVLEINETDDDNDFKTYGALIGGLVTVFAHYDNTTATKIIKELKLTNAKNDFAPVDYTQKTAKYNIKYAEKKVTFTILPNVK